MGIVFAQPRLARVDIVKFCSWDTIKSAFIFAEHECHSGLELMRLSLPNCRVANSARICCAASFVLTFHHRAVQIATSQSSSGWFRLQVSKRSFRNALPQARVRRRHQFRVASSTWLLDLWLLSRPAFEVPVSLATGSFQTPWRSYPNRDRIASVEYL